MRREVAATVVLDHRSGVIALNDAFGTLVFYRRGGGWGRGGCAMLVGSDLVAADGGAATVVVVIVGVVVGPVAHIGARLAVDRFGHLWVVKDAHERQHARKRWVRFEKGREDRDSRNEGCQVKREVLAKSGRRWESVSGLW